MGENFKPSGRWPSTNPCWSGLREGEALAFLTIFIMASFSAVAAASQMTQASFKVQMSPEGVVNVGQPPSVALDLLQTSAATPSPSISLRAGFDILNQSQAGSRVPDVQLAAGPQHLVEIVNHVVAMYTKDGSLIKLTPLNDFFHATGTAFDPKILFDPSSGTGGRWFASAGDYPITIRLAVSDSWDPTLTWRVYSVVGTANKLDDIDQPLMGLSSDKVVLTANEFEPPICFDPTTCFYPYAGAEFWVFNKAQLVAGPPSNVYDGRVDSGVLSINPAQSLSSTSIQYMVGTLIGYNDRNKVRIYAITGTPGVSSVKATKTSMVLQPFNIPPSAPQPDGAKPLDTGDYRVQDVAWFQGTLWFTFSTACTPPGDSATRSCIRLTQVTTSGTSTFTIAQQIDFGAASKYYFYPAISMDFEGNLALVYGFSSTTDHPSLAATGRSFNDPVGTLKPPIVLRNGTASKQESGPNDSTERYGDYFAAATDPVDASVIWLAGEYHVASPWSSYVAAVRVKDFSMSATPASLALEQGSSGSSRIDIASLGGFAGTVSLAAVVFPTGPVATLTTASITLAAGGSAMFNVTISSTTSTAVGTYAVKVTGTHDQVVSNVNVSVTIIAPSSGGGGGSVAYGSLITMEDGRLVPVQNIRVGDLMMGYDTARGQFKTSVVTSIKLVETLNQLIISTASGIPFRVDANPHQTLWVKTADGTVGWMPVTSILPGDLLFSLDGWIGVTGIEFAPAGTHAMFDLIATAPYFANGYLDPPIKV